MRDTTPPLNRKILLAFWKVHILHHAKARAVHGLWLPDELAEHGYRLSLGSLYPILERMERNGWLRSRQEGHTRSRRMCSIAVEGRPILGAVRASITEFHQEVGLGRSPAPPRKGSRSRREDSRKASQITKTPSRSRSTSPAERDRRDRE